MYDSRRHKCTTHMHASVERGQDCGLVGDKELQDEQDSLHATCTCSAAAAQCCSRGREAGLCG